MHFSNHITRTCSARAWRFAFGSVAHMSTAAADGQAKCDVLQICVERLRAGHRAAHRADHIGEGFSGEADAGRH